jgi:DNA primase
MVRSESYSVQLQDLLEQEIYPRLTAEQVYNHESHHWHKDAEDKWRGGCPFHTSKSGTSFYINPQTLLWRCPACGIGGGPIQYRHRLRGHLGGSPRGQDFIDEVRALAGLAGVPFPEREMSEQEQEEARRRDTRRAILEAAIIICEQALWSANGEQASSLPA